jgi:hypothetical protein
MNRFASVVCFSCGAFYAVIGMLLFFAPAFFFQNIAPIGLYNEHYSVDLGSFILPLGIFLIWAGWLRRLAQPILMVAALGSVLHLASYLRDGGHSHQAIAADTLFAVVASALLGALYACRTQMFGDKTEVISAGEMPQC